MHLRLVAILLITLLAPACALADSIWISTGGGGNAVELKNVTITGISEGRLLYQIAGRDNNRELETVTRMHIETEPAFSAAEEAFAAGRMDFAHRAYNIALQSLRKEWLRERIMSRLGDPAVQPGPDGSATTAPAAAKAAEEKLAAASAAIQKKDFAAAIQEINASRALFTEPHLQAQALFYLADAQAGQASPHSDVTRWKDAALAYMRVAAHFPDSPLAPPALLQVAQIQQNQLGDPAAAKALYEQIVKQYPNDAAAAAARSQLQPRP